MLTVVQCEQLKLSFTSGTKLDTVFNEGYGFLVLQKQKPHAVVWTLTFLCPLVMNLLTLTAATYPTNELSLQKISN